MGFLTVTKIVEFSAAHHLPEYEGDCNRLHGHTWKLEISFGMYDMDFQGGDTPETGMIIDFKKIKELLDVYILNKLDHRYLNELIKNPTAENLVMWIYNDLRGRLEKYKESPPYKFIFIDRITLWESPTSYVTWRK